MYSSDNNDDWMSEKELSDWLDKNIDKIGKTNDPYGRQAIDEDDIKAVLSVMKADYLTQGPLVPDFEDKLSEKIGVPYTVVVNSATSALHIACSGTWLGKRRLPVDIANIVCCLSKLRNLLWC